MDNTTPIYGPDGKLYDVGQQDADKAVASGGEKAILFNAPDGKQRWVKQSQFKDAIGAGGYLANPQDLTTNFGNEGVYDMAGPDKTISVPYSLVGSATKHGYQLTPTSLKTYMSDAAADPDLRKLNLRPGVKAVGRNTAGQPMVAPDDSGDNAGLTPTGTNKAGYQTYRGKPTPSKNWLERTATGAGDVLAGAAKGFGDFINPQVTPEERQQQNQSGPVANTLEAVLPGAYMFERAARQQVDTGQKAVDARNLAIQQEEAAKNATGQDKDKLTFEAAKNRTLAAGYGLGAIIPGTGPLAASAGEKVGQQLGEGNNAGASGTVIGNVALIAFPHLVSPLSSVLANSVTSLPEGARAGVRRMVGISDKTEDLINKFKEDSENVRKKNQEATEVTLGKRGVVDDARAKAAQEHADALVQYQRDVEEANQKHQESTNKRNAENAKIEQDRRDLQKKTKADNEQALKDHFAELEKIARDKQAAQGVDNQRATWQQQVEDDSNELRQRREKAETQAQADDKNAWDAVRAKTGGYSTDISNLQQITQRAADQADPATSALFKRIIKGEQPDLPTLTRNSNVVRYVDSAGNVVDRQGMSPVAFEEGVKKGTIKSEPVVDTLNPDDEGYGDLYEKQFGEPPPVTGGPGDFNRLQRWYSYLSNKMYGAGRVEGGLFNSYKMVRGALDDAMQDIAKQANATSELSNARKVHTQRMEAFSDSPTEQSTAATAYEKRVTPDEARDAAEEDWAKKLSVYDPEIANIGERIKKTRAALKQLPSDTDVRKLAATEAPTPPTPQPIPPDLQPHEFKPPVEPPKYPDEPQPQTPENTKSLRYEEPESTKPLPDAQKVPEEIQRSLNRGLRRYGAIGAWVLRSIVGGEALHVMHGSLSTFGSTMLMGQLAVQILTDALRKPKMIEWLAKPTAEDLRALDKLPPDDAARLRQALSVLAADEASKLGGKLPPFDPTISRFLLGASAKQGQQPTAADLKKEAARRRPTPAGLPPQATHYYDANSNSIMPVQ